MDNITKHVLPNLNVAIECANKYAAVPVSLRIKRTIKSPAEVFLILKKHSQRCYILESLENKDSRGRYTILGYDPKLGIDCLDGNLTIRSGTDISINTNNPGHYIKQILKENECPRFEHDPPFVGGLVGYFSYDYIKYAEPALSMKIADEEEFKDFDLMLFDKVITYDHFTGETILTAIAKTNSIVENYNMAVKELDDLLRLIEFGEPISLPPLHLKSEFVHLFSHEEYSKMVSVAKEHIKEGDIFQVVLSNRISAEADGSLFETYLKLSKTNPSPYMFYFSSSDIEIAGASPETLVKVSSGHAYTYPLAGTKPRGKTVEEDLLLEKELLSDQKELAEHNMLVDLGRNDIGKVSNFNTVNVEKYLQIERFSHVMHIGSAVSGQLRDGLEALDAIDAVLPAGTLSGAPKIRAREIINELENNKRGIYGGAIGYLSFSGDADTCIAIRIAFKKNGKVFVRSGAGIVADSVASREYIECENKAQAVLNALRACSNETAEEGTAL
ncbi:MAG: anthranilate synthase component I family protein [Christensenellaceae bacterium]|jgi:anthranilate synthase component 1|nr:anthranilate synthase component I family protein [Christensenellaceae bacterium]